LPDAPELAELAGALVGGAGGSAKATQETAISAPIETGSATIRVGIN